MGFYEILDQVVDLLRQRGRVTYRALKREFQMDDLPRGFESRTHHRPMPRY